MRALIFSCLCLPLCPIQIALAAPLPAKALLDAHNQLRAKHCAPPLRWSNTIAASAQKWADGLAKKGCVMQHSGGRYGENLAGGTAGALTAEAVVQMWYAEVKAFAFGRGGFSPKTGHFTQLVWKGTTELGCGKVSCGGLDLWVCQYDPPGNVEGEYRENVRPTTCR